jgi:hypothetical protein
MSVSKGMSARNICKAIAPVILSLYFCVFIAGAGWSEGVSNLDKYNSEKKDPGTAGILSVIPSLGHYYAGDWGRGVKFIFIDSTILVASFYSMGLASTNKGDFFDTQSFISMLEAGLIGGVLLFLAKTWEVADAQATVDDYNRHLKEKYGLSMDINMASTQLYYSYRF